MSAGSTTTPVFGLLSSPCGIKTSLLGSRRILLEVISSLEGGVSETGVLMSGRDSCTEARLSSMMLSSSGDCGDGCGICICCSGFCGGCGNGGGNDSCFCGGCGGSSCCGGCCSGNSGDSGGGGCSG